MKVFNKISQKALFQFEPETAHNIAISSFKRMSYGTAKALLNPGVPDKPVEVMGLRFKNPVGMAAGFDKNGECIDALFGMGFGFVEVGTVTPVAQPGNPKPRIFRLTEHQAIINRLGFNNKGVDYLVEQVKKTKPRSGHGGILGINIGKNKETPEERALDDYLIGLRKVYQYADYITVNISSPNTPGLRNLQQGEAFEDLLAGLKKAQLELADQHGHYVPMAIKIAPDIDAEDIARFAESLPRHKIDALIATNTTLDRAAVAGHPHAEEAGGLSGEPLTAKSTDVVAGLVTALSGRLPVIGVGGIHDAKSAQAKFVAGADLVQVYTGFICQGPQLIAEAVAR